MEILVERKIFTSTSTISTLFVNGKKQCYLLEDTDRGLEGEMSLTDIAKKKVYGKTAIPTGRYEVAVNYSNKFKKLLPLLLNVKGFEGIRIHPGNTESASLGCLLPGSTYTTDFVGQSRIAFNSLFQLITDASATEKVYLTIKRDLTAYNKFLDAKRAITA
jgi:hypothetical protein